MLLLPILFHIWQTPFVILPSRVFSFFDTLDVFIIVVIILVIQPLFWKDMAAKRSLNFRRGNKYDRRISISLLFKICKDLSVCKSHICFYIYKCFNFFISVFKFLLELILWKKSSPFFVFPFHSVYVIQNFEWVFQQCL